MRAGPASLQCDWSKAGLSMDLPVLVYFDTKTGLTFFQDNEAVGSFLCGRRAFNFKPPRKNVTELLFFRHLSLSRSTGHRGRNWHLLSDHFSVLMQLGLLLRLLTFHLSANT